MGKEADTGELEKEIETLLGKLPPKIRANCSEDYANRKKLIELLKQYHCLTGKDYMVIYARKKLYSNK